MKLIAIVVLTVLVLIVLAFMLSRALDTIEVLRVDPRAIVVLIEATG